MTLRKRILLLFVFMCQFVSAQNDSITNLNEVVVSDTQLKKYSSSNKVQVISDTIIQYNKPSLTSLLNYNTLLYFKEYGLGMTSSVAFRGTTAGQTAVIWNGININSQLLGQTDFNTITTSNFNSINIRSGGGSVLYGSSAIGGSIHLNNDLTFKPQVENRLQLSYGSFDTKAVNYNSVISTSILALNIGLSRNESHNNFTFPETNIQNINGEYYHNSINVSFGYKLNRNNFFKIYSQFYQGERHFSPALSSVSNSKYQNFDSRNLFEWNFTKQKFISNFKLALLNEEYKYFVDKDRSNFSFGKANTSIIKYNFGYQILDKMNIDFITDYSNVNGLGSDINNNTRKIGSFSLLFKQKISQGFNYELSVRKEITNQYKSPTLFSIGTTLQPYSFYKIRLNGSKNFRIPSFDDLYWQGSGNPDLKPETSLQAEISNDFFYKKHSFVITIYEIKISDLIRWNPNESGQWMPENVANVSSYGAEFTLNLKQSINNHFIDLMSTYGYTKSINLETNKQLIYVPFHKWVTTLIYRWKAIKFNTQLLYNGKVFTSSDNFYKLKAYKVFNSGINYENKRFGFGLQLANLFNEKYQNVLGRPLPGRNFTITINLNF